MSTFASPTFASPNLASLTFASPTFALPNEQSPANLHVLSTVLQSLKTSDQAFGNVPKIKRKLSLMLGPAIHVFV